jgi:uncharacterized protein YjbI with pentapeptide repeats
MKFEIKSRWSNEILFSLETKSLKLAVEAAVGQKTDLSGTNLSGANLSGASLSRADLSRADLSRADLYRADLSGANLSGADLSRADLSRADLSGADLSRADLSRADLYGAGLLGARGIKAERVTPLLILSDQVGKIRAYKLVNETGEGPYNGGIQYEAGKSYSVEDADTDPAHQCGAGINLATLDWCLSRCKEGYKILVVEFTSRDIAAIPIATDGKFRVNRCKVVREKDISDLHI